MSAKVSLHVAGLHRLQLEHAALRPRRLLEQRDHPHQLLRAVVADIVERVRARAAAGLHRAVVGGRAVEAGDDAARRCRRCR